MRSGLIGTHTPAVCGRSPLWFDPRGWRGTAPEEIESNAANQRCKACVRAVGDQW